MYSSLCAVLLSLVSINVSASNRCTSETPLDIIFMVDSSGSVYDEEYKNWENELELVYDIIDNVLPLNSRVGLINYSGCGSSFTFQECRDQNRLKKMVGLNDNGSPNDLQAVLSIVDAIDKDDFNGGYTWIQEALYIAFTEFAVNSTSDRSKMIVLLSDGEPYPYDQGHEACKTSTNYISPALTLLKDLNVEIITVGIDISEEHEDEYFTCFSDFYFEGTFDSSLVEDTHDQIGDTICSELDSMDFEELKQIPRPCEDIDCEPNEFISLDPIIASDPDPLPNNRCTSETPLDVIFMVDSSGSVYDKEYKNWENELGLVYDIIDNVLPLDSKVGLINFSGCGSSFSFQECRDLGRLKKMIGLNDNGAPNDLQAVLSIVDAIDKDDFNGGYTWIQEALSIALKEFNANSTADRSKMIIMLSAGEPYPYDQGHGPCQTSNNYVSPTLTSLKELNVEIITVGIDISEQNKDEYFTCMGDSYFEATFSSSLTEDALNQIGDIICIEWDSIDFEEPTQFPTQIPSKAPTASR